MQIVILGLGEFDYFMYNGLGDSCKILLNVRHVKFFGHLSFEQLGLGKWISGNWLSENRLRMNDTCMLYQLTV